MPAKAEPVVAPRPSRVKVGPYMYAIVYSDDAVNAAAVEMDDSIAAFSDHSSHMIGLPVKGRSEDSIKSLLLHELLHAVLALSASWYKSQKSKDAEESMIQSASHLLLGVLRDNPKVVAWLVEEKAE